MHKGRLEAFSDGVLAIVITIMVLELHAPHEPGWAGLRPLIPVFLSYILSFIYVGIYWNNHHHMFQAARHVNGTALWANLHLLFWLSLVPFVTSWMGETHFAATPVAAYGIVLLMCAVAYLLLESALIRSHGRESTLAKAIEKDAKEYLSVVLYVVGVPLAYWWPMISTILYAVVALVWLIPDKRIERILEQENHHKGP